MCQKCGEKTLQCVIQNEELVHYGTKDMHWHIRRYQNYDGTLTEEGRKRYGRGSKVKIESTKEGTKLSYSKSYLRKKERSGRDFVSSLNQAFINSSISGLKSNKHTPINRDIDWFD